MPEADGGAGAGLRIGVMPRGENELPLADGRSVIGEGFRFVVTRNDNKDIRRRDVDQVADEFIQEGIVVLGTTYDCYRLSRRS